MVNEPWVHVYVSTPEKIHQVLDMKEKKVLPKSTAYLIAFKILLILYRLI